MAILSENLSALIRSPHTLVPATPLSSFLVSVC